MNAKTFCSNGVPALQWGIANEQVARENFLKEAHESHVNLTYCPTGLYVNTNCTYLGATPDGLLAVVIVCLK